MESILNQVPDKDFLQQFLPDQKQLSKTDKKYYLNVVNTCFEGLIDDLVVKTIQSKQKQDHIEDNFIELCDDFKDVFKTELFNLQSSRFLSLLSKRNDFE